MAFHGKVVLVTGGASGMGKISARRLLAEGAKVAVFDMDEEAMEAMREEAKADGAEDRLLTLSCDVSKASAVKQSVAEVVDKLGEIDRLTHAAAIMPTELITAADEAHFSRLMEINYFGTVYLTKAVLPSMMERDSGDIILFGSIAGSVLTPHMGAYSATKAAVNVFGEQLIQENLDWNLRVLLVCPPATKTPLINQSLESSNPKSMRMGIEQNRFAEPEDIVTAIERRIEKGSGVFFPQFSAKWLTWMRRLTPGLQWKMMHAANHE